MKKNKNRVGPLKVYHPVDNDLPVCVQDQPTMDITELLAFSVKNKASDLHLSAGLPPMIRVHGDVRRINLPPMEHKDVARHGNDIANDGQRKHYEEHPRMRFFVCGSQSGALPCQCAFNQNRGVGAGL